MSESTNLSTSGGHCRDDLHCERVPNPIDSPQSCASGQSLDIEIRVMNRGEQIRRDAGTTGEEVAAVVDGEFVVEAADEHYRLSTGEGIIIPPGEARLWTCETSRGTLYRVVNRSSVGTPGDKGADAARAETRS